MVSLVHDLPRRTDLSAWRITLIRYCRIKSQQFQVQSDETTKAAIQMAMAPSIHSQL